MTFNLQQTDLGRSLRLVVALVVDGRCLLGVRDRAQPVKEIAEFPREVPRGPRFGLDLVHFFGGELRGPVRDVNNVRVRELGSGIFAAAGFAEEILPGLDFVPTATIAWFLTQSDAGQRIGEKVTPEAAPKRKAEDLRDGAIDV